MKNNRTTIEQQALRCDVLVVGAGPAGSTATRVAALEGARVLLVERRTQVGVPEQCAGYVAQAIRRHVDLPRECVAQAVSRLRTWLPDVTSHVAEMPGYLLNRAALDRHLAVLAVKAGATLLLRTLAVEIGEPAEVADRRVGAWHASPAQNASARAPAIGGGGSVHPIRVTLHSEGQEVLVEAGVVIGADGPQSIVARRAGLTQGLLARALQYEVVLPRRLEEAEVFFRPAFRGGYAWLFPAGDTARVGAAFAADCETGNAGLRDLMAELREEGRITGSAISYTSGFVPVGGPGPIRRGNILLAGDAAFHTHPITGAGIVNAIISGEMAGRAAARAALSGDAGALDEYGEEFHLVLGPALERAREKRLSLDAAWDLPAASLSKSIRESWIAFDEYYGN